MCGQLGLILGDKRRQSEERSYLKWQFIYLMLLSEKRGPYATGIGWLKNDGSHSIFKLPIPARKFIQESEFTEVISEADGNTTWLAGHTRWPTRGAVDVIANAQPIRSGNCIGTANGTILNADILFEQLNLPRFAEVDSEIIFRMADATLRDGRIDIIALKGHLALCRGPISAVMTSRLDPTTVVIVKGSKPLELRYHPAHKAIVYASDSAYLDTALSTETGWKSVRTEPMNIITFHCDDLPHFKSMPFTLARYGFQRYVGPCKEGKED